MHLVPTPAKSPILPLETAPGRCNCHWPIPLRGRLYQRADIWVPPSNGKQMRISSGRRENIAIGDAGCLGKVERKQRKESFEEYRQYNSHAGEVVFD
jgi:hypothetical protein